jgi:hypothetical protein
MPDSNTAGRFGALRPPHAVDRETIEHLRAQLAALEGAERRAFCAAFGEALGLAAFLDYMSADAAQVVTDAHIDGAWEAYKART